jgi:hypothetical protein
VIKKELTTATAAGSMSTTEAFPTAELALKLEVPTTVAASIPSQKVGEEC